MLPTHATSVSRKNSGKSKEKESSHLPPRLQNIFEVPSNAPQRKGMSKAEKDNVTIQTYAPQWRPNQKAQKKVKKRRPREPGAEMNNQYNTQMQTHVGGLWEDSLSTIDSFSRRAFDENGFLQSSTFIFPVDEVEPMVISRPGSRGGYAPEAHQPFAAYNQPSANIESAKKVRKSKKKARGTSRELGHDSFDELPRPQSALPVPAPVASPPRELTDEEREVYKNLPRPKSAMDAPGVRVSAARPSTSQSKASRSSQRNLNVRRSSSAEILAIAGRESGDETLRTESGTSSRRRLGENASLMKLKPKLFAQDASEKSSHKSGHMPKSLGCPDCFHAFGGLCIIHLQTSWKGSMKQALLEEAEDRLFKTLSGDCNPKLRVKIFTSTHQESRGKEMKFEIEADETLDSLKHRICVEDGTPKMFQRFIFRGKHLEDAHMTMAQCGIDNSSVVFVVLQPPLTVATVESGCDYCSMALGGVCTRHLREKRGDIYPKELRETFHLDSAHRAPRAQPIVGLEEDVDDGKLRRGHIMLQQFRVEIIKRFNSVYDAWIYYDMDGDGSITPKEFVALCRPLRLPKDMDIEHIFKEIDKKEELGALFPFTFVREVIWHPTTVDLRYKSEIYRALDVAAVNRREIFSLAQERSHNSTPIYSGINDVKPSSPKPSSPSANPGTARTHSAQSVSSSRPLSAQQGCPLCDKAINGDSHLHLQ